jgi:hypothetical protein
MRSGVELAFGIWGAKNKKKKKKKKIRGEKLKNKK